MGIINLWYITFCRSLHILLLFSYLGFVSGGAWSSFIPKASHGIIVKEFHVALAFKHVVFF